MRLKINNAWCGVCNDCCSDGVCDYCSKLTKENRQIIKAQKLILFNIFELYHKKYKMDGVLYNEEGDKELYGNYNGHHLELLNNKILVHLPSFRMTRVNRELLEFQLQTICKDIKIVYFEPSCSNEVVKFVDIILEKAIE